MVLRPDEEANISQTELSENRRRNVTNGIKSAVGIAVVAGSLGLSSKVLPFLSEYLPADLAIKGISRVSPKLGDFLKKGMSQGLDIKEGLDFIKEKITTSSKENVQDNKNIIEKYAPELHQFIDQEVRKGRSALQAGAIAQTDKKFKPIIDKLTKDYKTPWSNILESVYGSQGKAQVPQEGQQQKSSSDWNQIMQMAQEFLK